MDHSCLIPKAEYDQRVKRCADEAENKGLRGLLVWSNGGGNVDLYANVMYLANHYTPFPHIPDKLPYWAGKAHAALVLPVHEAPVLLVDCPDYRRDLVTIDDVRFGNNLPKLVADVMKEKGLGEGTVGLVANDTLLLGAYKILMNELPNVEFEIADDILEKFRMIKSENEIKIIRKTAEIGSWVMETIMSNVEPGKTEGQIMAEGIKETVLQGAAFYNFCVSSGPFSNYYSHGTLPSWDNKRKLQEGDLFHVDAYSTFEGYFFDFSRSTVVGGVASDEQKRILEGSVGVCQRIIQSVRPGILAEDLAKIGQEYLEKEGFIVSAEQRGAEEMVSPLDQSFPSFGHGLGLATESPWLVPGEKIRIEKGMYLAVERSVGLPGVGTAAFEENILVTDGGAEVLSVAKVRWW